MHEVHMTKQIFLPELGENIASGDILDIFVKEGDHIEVDQPLMELETEKASLEVPSSVSGKVVKVLVEPGEEVKVGQPILEMELGAAEPTASEPEPAPDKKESTDEKAAGATAESEAAPQAAKPQDETQPPLGRVPVAAPPSVRKFAREIGIDLSDVKGTGPGGRISMDDVKAHSRLVRQQAPVASSSAAPGVIPTVALPDFSQFGAIRREKMTKIRKVTTRSMAQSWSTIPHVTLHRSIQVTQVEQQRRRLKTSGMDNLTFTAILIKFAAHALKRFPKLNASMDLASEEIIYKDYYHIGVAVDTPKGLMVPVVKDADQKNIGTIADDLTYLSGRARDGKLSLAEMSGASFTITNLGGLGTEEFTPIINAPESAILGVGRAKQQPVWDGNAFQPEMMLPLSLSFDHRLIDGAEGARFMDWLATVFENPLMMAMEG